MSDTGRSGDGRADVVLSADHLDGIRAICERFGVGTMVSRVGSLVAVIVAAA